MARRSASDHHDSPAGSGRGRGSVAARASRVTKVYGTGATAVTALRGIDLTFPYGRFTAIMGPSGSGKSTLMHCLAGLDPVTSGRVFIGDVDLSRLGDRQLTQLRRDRIGFIFQQFNLLPTLTAAENITLPLDIAGRQPDKKWMQMVVDAVGLERRLRHRPPELSGGQQQRVACARALVTRPEIVFADEPTGNLDSRSGAEVLSFLRDSVRELGQTIVMVTHDPTAASYSDEVIFLADGRLVDAMADPTPDAVLDRMKHLDALVRGEATAEPEHGVDAMPPTPRGPRDHRGPAYGEDDEYPAAAEYPGDDYPDGDYPDGGFPDSGFPTGSFPTGGYADDYAAGYPAADYPVGEHPASGPPSGGFPPHPQGYSGGAATGGHGLGPGNPGGWT
ncbi:putative ABC transport system ATP-binding protein [Frankia sp. EI5c]|uniref:ABC transporter ATP-binding protein n=1 Tax=Frankia sp. EI5c TaxID=683316 RepID=UPI0007C36CDB|nr:ABC transporter ATP-binding protein [Frankia sp. EI5c]OAA28518.1 putative ABC transport system ATP-binding protein [Frankia sp. EI5c]